MITTKQLELHISSELLRGIEELHAKESGKQPFDSFIRQKTLQTLFQQLEAYNAFIKNGRKWNLASGETVELEIDGEPASFDSFSDSKHSKAETETISIPYSERMYSKAFDCASFNNAVIVATMKRNPNLKIVPYKTVGDWFKEMVFVPTFLKEGLEDEKKQLEEEAKELENQLAKKV